MGKCRKTSLVITKISEFNFYCYIFIIFLFTIITFLKGGKKSINFGHWGPPKKIIGVSPENLKLDNKKIVNVNNVKLKEIDR
jgi:hypothetical protein